MLIAVETYVALLEKLLQLVQYRKPRYPFCCPEQRRPGRVRNRVSTVEETLVSRLRVLQGVAPRVDEDVLD